MATAKVVRRGRRDHEDCRFKCCKKFDAEAQLAIHQEHWSLVDDNKRHFYMSTTTCRNKARSRRAQDVNKKKVSYSYFFFSGHSKIRVCKDFYLNTLNIDAKRIRNAHASGNPVSPAPYKRGRHVKKTCASLRASIRQHIDSIPVIESHYCRRDTNKVYLNGQLNLKILYEKYVEYCYQTGRTPAKEHLYRQIFNQEYNIGFLKPKKDRCDICEVAKMNKENSSEKYEKHLRGKHETYAERRADRECREKCVVSFDLQNVFALPQANVSNFFYKRKLNVYHLTAHYSLTKQCYGVLWPESLSGRSGNDIASGLVRILENIIKDNPSVTEMTLWSDSCTPQNRNRIMTAALMLFIQRNPSVTLLTQKFCEPGHSSIQEVDNLHSQIEKVVTNCEIFSPLGLVRVLCKTPRKKPLKLTQLRMNDMRDYLSETNRLRFDGIPFTKVKAIQYSADNTVSYKTSFADENWTVCDLTVQSRSMTKGQLGHAVLTEPKRMSDTKTPLSAEKVKDLKSMLSYMPEPDREYMKTLLKCPKQDCKVQQVDDQTVQKSSRQEAGPSGKVAKKAKESPVTEPRKSVRKRSARHQEVDPSEKMAKKTKESPVVEPRKSVRKRASGDQQDTKKLVQVGKQRKRTRRA